MHWRIPMTFDLSICYSFFHCAFLLVGNESKPHGWSLELVDMSISSKVFDEMPIADVFTESTDVDSTVAVWLLEKNQSKNDGYFLFSFAPTWHSMITILCTISAWQWCWHQFCKVPCKNMHITFSHMPTFLKISYFTWVSFRCYHLFSHEAQGWNVLNSLTVRMGFHC